MDFLCFTWKNFSLLLNMVAYATLVVKSSLGAEWSKRSWLFLVPCGSAGWESMSLSGKVTEAGRVFWDPRQAECFKTQGRQSDHITVGHFTTKTARSDAGQVESLRCDSNLSSHLYMFLLREQERVCNPYVLLQKWMAMCFLWNEGNLRNMWIWTFIFQAEENIYFYVWQSCLNAAWRCLRYNTLFGWGEFFLHPNIKTKKCDTSLINKIPTRIFI